MQLAIIGAGMAGLAAGRALRARFPDWAITIYEKSRGIGGRVATRRRAGFTFDHGAQCIKSPSPAVERLITDELASDTLRRIALPTWTFDAANTIAEGDAAQNAAQNYTYADGNNRLGKLLADELDVRREVRIAALQRTTTDDRRPSAAGAGRWMLLDLAGATIGAADLVLLTPPAPQIVELLTASDFDATTLLAALGAARYRRCISLALAYDRLIARPFYALINSDRAHPISWLALEHAKGAERCPPEHSLLIAQMAAQWSVDHYETPLDTLTPLITEYVSALLGDDLGAPLWADLQRWRYSLPDAAADFDTLNQLGAPHGLFFAGDYTDSKGRVHLAIERGWQVAELIAAG